MKQNNSSEIVVTMKASAAVSPLYIFGYGSLLWRPGDLLGTFPSYLCTAYNWKRLFVQRSCDHRGVDEFPGLVATMVEDNDLQTVLKDINWITPSLDSSINPKGSECVGLVWLIPEDSRQQLLEELDYREKGGYTRHNIKVRLHQQTPYHSIDELTEAIVYTGHISNDLFDFKPLKLGSNHFIKTNGRHSSITLRPQNPGANIIAASKGPSGTNIEYLFGLIKFIKENGLSDEYLDNLCYDVLLRIGPWRARHVRQLYLYQQPSCTSYLPTYETVLNDRSRNTLRKQLLGWGSNEFQQLVPWFRKLYNSSNNSNSNTISTSSIINETVQEYTVDTHTADMMIIKSPLEIDFSHLLNDNPNSSTHDNNQPIKYSFSLRDNSTSIYIRNNSCILSHKTSDEYSNLILLPIDTANSHSDECARDNENSIESEISSTSTSLVHCNVLNDHLVAGGRWSGRLIDSKLTLWGSGLHDLFDLDLLDGEVTHNNTNMFSIVEIYGVSGCSIGHDHILIVTCKGIVIGLGDNSHGQCLGVMPLSFQINNHRRLHRSNTTYATDLQTNKGTSSQSSDTGGVSTVLTDTDTTAFEHILKVSAGLKHSVAITKCGKVYAWGQNLHGQCLDNIYTSVANQSAGSSTTSDINIIKNHSIGVWQTADGSHFIDVACGAKHTCVVDDLGRVYTFGSNTYGALGRSVNTASASSGRQSQKDNRPNLIEMTDARLQDGIRWQKVSCVSLYDIYYTTI